MEYSKFDIKNFKGIKELELDFTRLSRPKIFTLVGLNESGKTTILEAIDFFRNNEKPQDSYKFIPKNKKANFNDSISVTAHLKLDEKDEAEIKSFLSTLNLELKNKIENISIEKNYKFESRYKEAKRNIKMNIIVKSANEENEKELTPEMSEWTALAQYLEQSLLPKVIYYPNFLFDFPSKIYLEQYSNEEEKQAFYRKILQDILDFLEDGLDLKTHLIDRIKSDKPEDKESLEALLNKMGSKVTGVIFAAWETMFHRSVRKEILFNIGKDDKGNFIEVKLKENNETYNIDERSLGFKWFFTFLLFTEFRKRRKDDPGQTIFLLDEPAYNLHSTAQMKLLKTFETLASGCMLIYATHSHHLIEPKWLNGTYIVRNKSLDYQNEEDFDNNQTDIASTLYRQFVANSPNDTNYFQPILDKLEYQPSRLEDVPNIVITEGKNDFYTFKYVYEIILGNSDEIKFYPGNGVNKLDSIFRLYLAWGRDFVAIFDSDRQGADAKLDFIKDIGPDVANKIFTLKDINVDWDNISTEDLFTSAEKMQIIKRQYNTDIYDKSKFNSAIQQLYTEKTNIELSNETKEKFKQIFNFIKGKL